MDQTKTYAEILEMERRCIERIGETPKLEGIKETFCRLFEMGVELAYHLGRYDMAQERLAETADKEKVQ
jgi:GTP cyclohydrolase I